MSIPYQIADVVDFDVLICEGLDTTKPIVEGNEPLGNNVDVLLRADPANGSDPADPATWIYVGNKNRQEFPLRDNESMNVHVTRRHMIYFRGPVGARLHLVSAQIQPGGAEV